MNCDQVEILHNNDNEISEYSFEEKEHLEDEQEMLNSAVIALTTHFAQVQFRLRQIVDAPKSDKQDLLKALEEFAFRGIPNIGLIKEMVEEAGLAETVRLKRVEQRRLIEQLKSELTEFERHAYETEEAYALQDVVIERQRLILNELKTRLNLELDEQKYYYLTQTDAKQQVDVELRQFLIPLRIKEDFISQLKIQLADLERFVSYLKAYKKKSTKCLCSTPKPYRPIMEVIEHTAGLLQMFVVLKLGCASYKFKRADFKMTKYNHWGDLRAKMELAIARVAQLVKLSKVNKSSDQGNYDSDNDLYTVVHNVKVTTAVRKHLATSIRDLMQHGATVEIQTRSLVPLICCLSPKFCNLPIHAWEIILHYYYLNNGERFNSTPARKLSQSYNLNIVNNQNMLTVIGNIIVTHSLYKRNYDSQFKAFVSAGLNANKLATWLSSIFHSQNLIEMHYHPWSYVMKTGFADGLQSLESLASLQFDLPVNLAIRHFQNIKDLFT
ncbi:hypothetical protein FQA39_LY03304 [Lamprigera yunnana]|nr:hypothetical protein FQA39_LY03304 [Lamprigera yunnana]